MWIVIVLILLIVLIIISEYNGMKTLQNKVKQSRSSIDVYLNQRFDLIPNLVECVKGYANYEKELFEKVAEFRTKYNESKDLVVGAALNNKVNQMLMLSEKYPDIKASENFLDLQRSISKMENTLQAARRLYNSDVTIYNVKITTFPGVLFAKYFGFKPEDVFVIEEYKKENIEVKL